MINWSTVQQRLASAGYATGPVDGVPGRATFTALFAHQARRQPDITLMSMGLAAATELPRHGISDNAQRLAEFLGQTNVESGGYSRFEENMHYSAKRLMAVWPSRFHTLAAALPYAWDPSDADHEDVALADLVYGGRMGNEANGTADDDGWAHRGRGILQHTGAGEYALLKERLGLDPDDVAIPAKSVAAAADYWDRRGVNAFCDRGDWTGARRAVNGGTIGLLEVSIGRSRAMTVLA